MPNIRGDKAPVPTQFQTKLPAWDGSLPSEKELTQVMDTFLYGMEPVPDLPGYIRDFVVKFDAGPSRCMEESIVIPEEYWVPLSMLNWTITVHQYVGWKAMCRERHAGASHLERNALALVRNNAIALAWWYIRCRECVRKESEGKGGHVPESGHTPNIVPTLNEFLWREANEVVGWKSMTQEEMVTGIVAQKVSIAELCKPGGAVGQLHPPNAPVRF